MADADREVRAPGGRFKMLLRWLLTGAFIAGAVFVLVDLGARVLVKPKVEEPAPMQAHELSKLDASFHGDIYTWWSPKPNLDNFHVTGRCFARDIDFHYSTDENGLRQHSTDTPDDAVRILALGDSVTFGLGVNDSETWPAALERNLREADPKVPYAVINSGVPGFTVYQGLRFLQFKGLALHPSVVIACFGQNDFQTWEDGPDLERARREAPLMDAYARGAGSLSILVTKAWLGFNKMFAEHADPNLPRLSRDEFRDTLEQLRKLCATHGIPLILLRWPPEKQVLAKDAAPINYEDVLLSYQTVTGVQVVDLFPVFAAKQGPLYVDDVHGNPAACAAAGETLVAPVLQAVQASTAPAR